MAFPNATISLHDEPCQRTCKFHVLHFIFENEPEMECFCNVGTLFSITKPRPPRLEIRGHILHTYLFCVGIKWENVCQIAFNLIRLE